MFVWVNVFRMDIRFLMVGKYSGPTDAFQDPMSFSFTTKVLTGSSWQTHAHHRHLGPKDDGLPKYRLPYDLHIVVSLVSSGLSFEHAGL